jgi:hypothetical protein
MARKLLCQGKNNTGNPCQKWAINGRNYCFKHGGKVPVGRLHPRFKHGMKSRYALPTRMQDAYEASMGDQRLLQMRSEIALCDSRLNDLLKRVDSGESGRLWKRLSSVHTEFARARSSGKVDVMQEKLAELEALIRTGKQDHDNWREVHETLDLRRKLVESERKRIMEQQQVVTSDRLLVFMGAMMDILVSEVADKPTLRRVSDRILALAKRDEPVDVESHAV